MWLRCINGEVRSWEGGMTCDLSVTFLNHDVITDVTSDVHYCRLRGTKMATAVTIVAKVANYLISVLVQRNILIRWCS